MQLAGSLEVIPRNWACLNEIRPCLEESFKPLRTCRRWDGREQGLRDGKQILPVKLVVREALAMIDAAVEGDIDAEGEEAHTGDTIS